VIEWAEHLSTASITVAAAVAVVAAVLASGHAVLYKRDDRGAMMWVGLIWAIPLMGPSLYLAFGINRIKRRAVALRKNLNRGNEPGISDPKGEGTFLSSETRHLAPLVPIVDRVVGQPLLGGNELAPLLNAEGAYPEMVKAITGAKHTIALSTYIFDRDEAGLEFAISLGAAVRRGVMVRVLIDATGTLFTRHSIVGVLKQNSVPFARFLPAIAVRAFVSLNLRTHRKLLIVDGRTGFTGGMNICAPRLRAKRTSVAVEDVQFQIQGPVVAQLQQTFVNDWRFTTGETLAGAKWFPVLRDVGSAHARGIADGPDEEFERTRWTILGAITLARSSLRILTPYFLPDLAIISALNLAALRGVTVDIVLPTDGDVPFVQWASEAHWWQLLEHGCRIWVAPAPFDHSKIFIVDDAWVLLGSSNWDPRSLRLNFEFNLECYDGKLARELATLFDRRKQRARAVTLEEANSRQLLVRVRDGLARLITPFL
jgi:cardiolipin synthase